MGRFSNLEFSDRPAPREDDAQPGVVRDGNYYLGLAREMYRGARFEPALRYFSRALEFDPNLAEGWWGQIQMLNELGEFHEADVWAGKALEIHRDHPDLLSARAVAFARSGEVGRALEYSDGAMKQKGVTVFAWLARGEALCAESRGNPEHCFGKARSESKGDWFVTLLAGRIYLLYGDAGRAGVWVKQSLAQASDRPFAWMVLGDSQRAMGLRKEAEESYRRVLSLDREFTPAEKALTDLQGEGPLQRWWQAVCGLVKRPGGAP